MPENIYQTEDDKCYQCGKLVKKGTYHYCENVYVQPVTIFNNFEYF